MSDTYVFIDTSQGFAQVKDTQELQNEALNRRHFSQEERDNMDSSDFGDPENQAFPIKSAQDVINASMRLHNASGDKAKIKSRIKAIAKRKGFALPSTWEEDGDDEKDSKDRVNTANQDDPDQDTPPAPPVNKKMPPKQPTAGPDDEDEDDDDQAAEQQKQKKKQVKTLSDALEDDQATQDRRFFPLAEKEQMDDADFGDPERKSFPIKTAEDVIHASMRLGNAKGDQNKIKARIKAIAKRKGFPLPKSWQNEDEEKESASDKAAAKERMSKATQTDSAGVGKHHAPHAGTHGHRHDHAIDGYSHDHPHDHMDDNDHDHGHAHAKHRSAEGLVRNVHTHTPEERALYKETELPLETEPETQDRSVIQTSNRPSMYMPFTRVDVTKREVIGQATAEVPDSYGTIFAYYPKAWELWRGNIREQHDPKKAVGKRVQHFLNEDSKSVDLHVRVSRGAQDTWMKVEDDVLTGFSLSVIPDREFGNDIARWPRKMYEGREYPYLPRYTIAEVSLVDNPSCPNCNIQIVRADGFATDVLDLSEEEVVEAKPVERAGTRVSNDTKNKMHKSIAHSLHSAMSQMDNCGCDACLSAMKAIDPDGDGDIDLGGYDDPDNDSQQVMKRALEPDIEHIVTGIVERSLQPVYTRLQRVAGTLAKTTPEPIHIDAVISDALMRAFDVFESKLSALPTQSSLDELRAELSAVKGQVDRIAETPLPGGPVMNASAVPQQQRSAQPEKSLATDAPLAYARQSYGAVYDAIASMAARGSLDTVDKQVDALSAGLIAQRRG